MRKIDLQLFTTQPNLTDKAAVATKAREIDFVTSFNKDLSQFLNVIGISRMIEKPNGTQLNTKKVTGTLQTEPVAEGDEIPLSKFTVKETPYETITIEKFRKAVSVEAITEKGYEAAVAMTDAELKNQLRKHVTDKFYTQLNKGSLTGTKTTFQAGVANAIGLVKDKFEKMQKGITGVAVFVNTLDLYDYLGDKAVTVETAFGLNYIKNFLGADAIFLTSKVASGTVIATPFNNLVGYYINPANSELTKAGLSYTADSNAPYVGFHADGNYSRATSEVYAMMGITVFAEFLDGIAKVTVSPGKSA